MRKQALIGALVLGLTVGCDGPSGPAAEAPIEEAPRARPGTDETPDVDSPVEAVGGPPSAQTAALVRRAELQSVPVTSAPAIQQSAVLRSLQCAELSAVAGRLDSASNKFAGGRPFSFLYETFLVTARSTGKVSIASSVQPIGDSYRYGYGYPLSAQAVEQSDGMPSLTPSLVANSAVLDNALDDGEARLDLEVEAGKQYMVTYKGLVGSASPPGSAWTYTLGFCAGDLAIEGKLWVSDDAEDLVPVEPLTGPISVTNAPHGAMSRLAEDILVAP